MTSPLIAWSIGVTVASAASALALSDARARQLAQFASALSFALGCYLTWHGQALGLSLPASSLAVFALVTGIPRVRMGSAQAAAALASLGGTWLLLTASDWGLLLAGWVLTLAPIAPASGGPRRLPTLVLGLSAVLFAAAVVLIGLSLNGPAGTLLLLAVLLRQGIFPFHSWIPAASESFGPVALALLLGPQAGALVLRRMGPLLAVDANMLVALSAGTAIYASLLALTKRPPARTFAWIACSQSALAFANYDGNVLGVSLSIALPGFALAVAAINARLPGWSGAGYRGLADRAPLLSALFLLLGFAVVGLPGSASFVGVKQLLHHFSHLPLVLFASAIAVACNGYSVLSLFSRAFYGPERERSLAGEALLRERFALTVLLTASVIVSFFPS